MAEQDPLGLLEMPKSDFEKFVKEKFQSGGTPTPTAQLPASPVEGQQLPIEDRDRSFDLASEGNKRMALRAGISLDTKTGAPADVRFKMGLDDNQLNQFKLLTKIYGPGNVDLSEDGR